MLHYQLGYDDDNIDMDVSDDTQVLISEWYGFQVPKSDLYSSCNTLLRADL